MFTQIKSAMGQPTFANFFCTIFQEKLFQLLKAIKLLKNL